jgi:hypothetical protein
MCAACSRDPSTGNRRAPSERVLTGLVAPGIFGASRFLQEIGQGQIASVSGR